MTVPFITRTKMARKLGAEAAQRAEDKANNDVSGFSERALAHIHAEMLAAGRGARVRGEDLVNSAKFAGIRPVDDRAFGSVFARAIKQGLIEPVGFAPRTKGHGTAGGRVYGWGRALA
ncbi:MAG: hypothetical protein LBE61_09555 [Burkholderiaceae bacterium]|jgi:hypothetical protein|nr:hypothetical protein [Burkholderiaceae bacterium]